MTATADSSPTRNGRDVVAALVGVSSPAPFQYRGFNYHFDSLGGVDGDLDWYASLLKGVVPEERLTLHRWDTASQTGASTLRRRLREVAIAVQEGGLFVLVLCGHGFQASDDNGDEPDKLDEVFAAADGPILDDHFGQIWDQLQPTVDVVALVDTCSADSLAIAGGRSVEPVLAYRARGPARLSISASMAWERAGEVRSRDGVRGQLSLALEDAWLDPGARVSYLAWFREAADLLAVRRPQQHPRLRFLGPEDRLLNLPPFT